MMKRGWIYRLAFLVALLVGVAACDTGSHDGSSLGKRGEDGGFLWKPVSESNGRLVILLPTQYRGRVGSCYVADSNGNIMEVGVFTTDSHNGNRPHFRFTKPGGAFGQNVYAVADIDTGTVHWPIPNGAIRTEY